MRLKRQEFIDKMNTAIELPGLKELLEPMYMLMEGSGEKQREGKEGEMKFGKK